jgi:cholesterol oxidase
MEVLASLGQPRPAWWLRPMAPLLWRMLGFLIPFGFRQGWLSRPLKHPGRNAGDPSRMTNLFAIGRDNANGQLVLRGGSLDIRWDYERENRELIAGMEAAMSEVAEVYGGTFAPLASWELFRRIVTVHSLGGCHLSDSPDRGVVSPRGEVHGYPGLYVSDGSVIPTSIGFHPVMTISAVSEHIAEGLAEGFG